VRIAVVDYGAGNLHSVRTALSRAGAAHGLAVEVVVGADPDVVARADRIVLPGDGAFRDCAAELRAAPGLVEALDYGVRRRGRPFLGICVGMQLLADEGHEHGVTAGLGWIGGAVRPFGPLPPPLRSPHMGWNTLDAVRPHALIRGIPLGPDGWHAYFLHGYRFEPASPGDLVLEAEHGGPVAALVAEGPVAGVQFHPEKSQKLGLALLANFLAWSP
jgi:glutamine amidotransferase